MFKKILIANRGEIVVRIAQTLQQMGIRAAGVHSEADRRSLHVECLDEVYALPGNTAAETYLRGDRIIEVAQKCGAEAIHPGYGFLSENPRFAQMCRDAGLVFVGPKPEVMRVTGNKIEAKKALADAGVPVAPAWHGPVQSAREYAAAAKRIGYPVLVKAAAGGGGKGMRLVGNETDLEDAWESAKREASAAFGDGQVFIEKYLSRPRHVEFQILGDDHGNVLHLFERECSIQRRHQKIVEETPSPALSAELRERMAGAAVRAAKALGYTNAGTVEFLLDERGEFYFLEINTRLQVEHPITEATLGIDLVRAQVLIAAGGEMPFGQADLSPRGHAIECRVYAEDPARGFLPSTGVLRVYAPPSGPGIRVDAGVAEGSEVSTYYDPMLAKVICWGGSREESLARMSWALSHFAVLGVTTNIEFLQQVVGHPAFVAGRTHTEFLSEHADVLKAQSQETVPEEALIAAAIRAMRSAPAGRDFGDSARPRRQPGPWSLGGAWRGA